MLKESEKIWMDGKLVDWKDARVHVLTHTLHYGVGVFEGIRCYKTINGPAIFRLDDHVERLFSSAHIVNIDMPYSREEIREAIKETVTANRLEACYIRPIVYIGYGSMGLYVEDNPVNVAIAAWSWGSYLGDEGLERGIRVKISSFTRHHVNISMTRAKVPGYYVNSVLAKKEVKAAGYDEAVLLDPDGYIAEGSGENIFIIRKGRIKTTPLTSILEGITRESIIQIARDKGISVIEERFTRDDLYIADEAFLTGTAAELTPIREVDNRVIGSGKPGPVTKNLQETFFNIVYGKDTRYKDWLTYL
ncbi:MAG: branched chain amino acid aminotransferase [Nitrospirae bacterium RIFCSPLOW2_12_42_9]|nr:MAG: branched chain amino acid aminotransferase [Nitrospirae bacterium GWA2_42_11]OGW58532.1 MAG: branched chain amino acid aminotransferase [Nitrospirae bacterium RIFCSPHIGHO2_02_FULL_42_12]OGW59698.1 MAG: branched chain amino acid aminotransferase [Nitrospirae bacterium RIFCSPLOW2_12_42_9]